MDMNNYDSIDFLQELLNSDELSENEKQQIADQIQKLQQSGEAEQISNSVKAANMLAQLEADINPKANNGKEPSVNGVEILNQDGTVRIMKVGRNDPCPCGSGKKYKKCCGR